MIEIGKSLDGYDIFYRDQRQLCSHRNPVLEAYRWVSSLELESETEVIFVLGVGAGHHLRALTFEITDRQIMALEVDQEILGLSYLPTEVDLIVNSKLSERTQFLLRSSYCQIFCFRPSWQGREAEYLKAYDLVMSFTDSRMPIELEKALR